MHCLALLLLSLPLAAALVPDVRGLANKGEFAAAEKLLEQARGGDPSEWLEAHSWLGRGALNNKLYDKALDYASKTREMALAELKKRPMDQEKRLPIAFGASQEVQAQALAATGRRSEAVAFLQAEFQTYGQTSIRTRMQKNLNLLTLEGQPAPLIAGKNPFIGKITLVFLWAHWCGDCKAQAPILARLREEFGQAGFHVVGPTKLYGYAARGEDATPAVERGWIDQVVKEHYAMLPEMPVIVDEATFTRYGASTTPTLVLVDRKGIVRKYHPGKLTHEELSAAIRKIAAS